MDEESLVNYKAKNLDREKKINNLDFEFIS
jgi:hypothetical protein